jgi:hypothetical protein
MFGTIVGQMVGRREEKGIVVQYIMFNIYIYKSIMYYSFILPPPLLRVL